MVDRLVEVAKGNRYGHRDATMILVAYRHALAGVGAGMSESSDIIIPRPRALMPM